MTAIRLESSVEHFLRSISELQSNIQTVQRRLSTGIRIERASDSPTRVVDIIARETQLERSEQVRTNLGRASAEVEAGSQSIQLAIRAIEQAIVIGSQAATSVQTSPERQATLAAQVSALHDELVRLSNTTAEGRFIFAGDDSQQAPYQANSANPNGVDRLTTADATRMVLDVDGSRFLAGRTAEEIFDHRLSDDSLAPDNAFAALQDLLAAAQSGDTTAAEAALDRLHAAHDHLNHQLAFYGSVQDRIDNGVNRGHDLEVQLRTELSAIRDTDLAAAAVELARLQSNIQIAVQAQSSFTTPSLFDFLR